VGEGHDPCARPQGHEEEGGDSIHGSVDSGGILFEIREVGLGRVSLKAKVRNQLHAVLGIGFRD
jgi:hypothetical protein